MKKLFSLILVSLALCLSGRAELATVTSLNSSTPKTLIVVGQKVQNLIIQNTGGNQINISIDGGASNGGADPTTTTTGKGIILPAGSYVALYGPWLVGQTITAITATGTTTVNIITNAPNGNSSFPTS